MQITKIIQKAFSAENLPFIIKLGTGILGVFLFSIVISRLVYPYDLGYLEAFNWMPAGHLLEGKNPYAFGTTPPYSMVPYGIVYYALLAIGQKLFGLQLWWGRFLSVLAFAVCLWAVVKITKKLTENKETMWAVCLISLALFPAHAWIAIVRSDLIGLAFALAAVALAFTFEKDEPLRAKRLIAVVLLSVAAFFTKHTFLLPFGIIGLRLWQVRKWRESFVFGAAFLILTALGMFLLNYTSGGGYIWQHFTHAQRLPFNWEGLAGEVFRMLTAPTMFIFIIFLLIFVYRNRAFFNSENRAGLFDLLSSPKILIWFYLFLSFAVASVSVGREGANVNYYLENSFVIAIAGGLIYDEFRGKSSPKLALAMIVLFVCGGAFQLARFGRGAYFHWQATSYFREISGTNAKFAPAGSICFSVYVELAANGGCTFYFDDYGEYIGAWSPELNVIFEREVIAGRFAAVIWKTDDFAEKFPNYRLVPMSQPVPPKVIPVYLFVRKTETAQ